MLDSVSSGPFECSRGRQHDPGISKSNGAFHEFSQKERCRLAKLAFSRRHRYHQQKCPCSGNEILAPRHGRSSMRQDQAGNLVVFRDPNGNVACCLAIRLGSNPKREKPASSLASFPAFLLSRFVDSYSVAKFILIGSGLAGGLLAAYLGRRGYDVDLYERRADPREGNIIGGRSINLALSTRGVSAVEQRGIAGGGL